MAADGGWYEKHAEVVSGCEQSDSSSFADASATARAFFFLHFFPHFFKPLYHLRRCSRPNPFDLFCKSTARTCSKSTSLRKKRLLKPWDVSPLWSGVVWTTSLSNVCECVVFVVYMPSVGDAPPAGYTRLKCSQWKTTLYFSVHSQHWHQLNERLAFESATETAISKSYVKSIMRRIRVAAKRFNWKIGIASIKCIQQRWDFDEPLRLTGVLITYLHPNPAGWCGGGSNLT